MMPYSRGAVEFDLFVKFYELRLNVLLITCIFQSFQCCLDIPSVLWRVNYLDEGQVMTVKAFNPQPLAPVLCSAAATCFPIGIVYFHLHVNETIKKK